jgi:hypothetical protein
MASQHGQAVYADACRVDMHDKQAAWTSNSTRSSSIDMQHGDMDIQHGDMDNEYSMNCVSQRNVFLDSKSVRKTPNSISQNSFSLNLKFLRNHIFAKILKICS